MAIVLTDKRSGPAATQADEGAESRRRRDPEATRKAILDAAEDLFVQLGPDATTTAEIAKAARINKSLIHHHFGSKEALWEEVKRRHFGAYFAAQKQMLAAATEPTAELLRASLHAFFRFLQSDPKSVRFMSWSFCENELGKIDQEKELFELGIERIRQSQEAGTIRSDIEPLFVIKTFVALALHWFQTCRVTLSMIDSEISPAQLDELYLDTATKILLEGVRPPRTA